MKWWAGMDGGGTRTRLAVVREDGRESALAETGCCSFVELGLEEARRALRDLWSGAQARSPECPGQADALFMGMGSILAPDDARTNCRLAVEAGLVKNLDRVEAGNDAESALAGGLLGRPGILLIAGTGSACVGRDREGRTWRAGGWGHLLEDRGSAHGLGRAALIAATRDADGRGARTALRSIVCEALGLGDLKEIYRKLHHEGVARSAIAGLARQVVEQARLGDEVARRIVDEETRGLVEMVAAVARRLHLEKGELVLTGGLVEGAADYRDTFRRRLAESLPELRIVPALLPPVLGAVLLAGRKALGSPVPEPFLDRLRGLATERETTSPTP